LSDSPLTPSGGCCSTAYKSWLAPSLHALRSRFILLRQQQREPQTTDLHLENNNNNSNGNNSNNSNNNNNPSPCAHDSCIYSPASTTPSRSSPVRAHDQQTRNARHTKTKKLTTTTFATPARPVGSPDEDGRRQCYEFLNGGVWYFAFSLVLSARGVGKRMFVLRPPASLPSRASRAFLAWFSQMCTASFCSLFIGLFFLFVFVGGERGVLRHCSRQLRLAVWGELRCGIKCGTFRVRLGSSGNFRGCSLPVLWRFRSVGAPLPQ